MHEIYPKSEFHFAKEQSACIGHISITQTVCLGELWRILGTG